MVINRTVLRRGSVVASTGVIATALVIGVTGIAQADPLDWQASEPSTLDTDSWFEDGAPIADDDVWGVGSMSGSGNEDTDRGMAQHWDGTRWTNVDVPEDIGALNVATAVASDDVWAFGDDPFHTAARAAHWDGTKWSAVEIPPPGGGGDEYSATLYGGDMVSESDGWAVGGNMTVEDGSVSAFAEHWDGTQWSMVDLPAPDGATATYLNGIAMRSADDGWAAGTWRDDKGAYPWLLHWDGAQWAETEPPKSEFTSLGLFDISVDADTADVWAAGVDESGSGGVPVLLHWDDDKWSFVDTGIEDGSVKGIGPDGSGGVVMAGYTSKKEPLLLRYDGSTVTREDSPEKGAITRLLGVERSMDDGRTWVLGDYLPAGGTGRGLALYAG